jgi:hypothetical protein
MEAEGLMRRALSVGWLSCWVALGCGNNASQGDAGAQLDGAAASDGATPGGDMSFETEQRYLFIVDTSGSMSLIDKNASRAQAVAAVVTKYNDLADSAVIVFNSPVSDIAGFINNWSVTQLETALSVAQNQCDHEGALDQAKKTIDKDAMSRSATARAHTHYNVAFLTGNLSSPECDTGTTPCDTATCNAGSSCRAGTCIGNANICNIPRSQWGNLMPPLPMSLFPSLMPGMDYNTAARVAQKVKDLVALVAQDQIGAITFDTVLVFDPAEVNDPKIKPLLLDRDGTAAYLKSLAQAGGGNYYDLSTIPSLPY